MAKLVKISSLLIPRSNMEITFTSKRALVTGAGKGTFIFFVKKITLLFLVFKTQQRPTNTETLWQEFALSEHAHSTGRAEQFDITLIHLWRIAPHIISVLILILILSLVISLLIFISIFRSMFSLFFVHCCTVTAVRI